MVVLPLVVRGIGPGGYTGLLTDEDVDLVFNDLAAYRLVDFFSRLIMLCAKREACHLSKHCRWRNVLADRCGQRMLEIKFLPCTRRSSTAVTLDLGQT